MLRLPRGDYQSDARADEPLSKSAAHPLAREFMRRFFAVLLVAVMLTGPAVATLAAWPPRAGSPPTPSPARQSGPDLMLPNPDVYPIVPFTRSADDPGVGTRGSGPRTTGILNILVILVRFTDTPGTTSQASINVRLNDASAGAMSVHNYYEEASYGRLDLRFTVTPWLSSTRPMSDYGADSSTNSYDDLNGPIYRLTTEAVQLADPSVDFRPFDGDNDTVVDHLLVVHAGDAEESSGSANDIWSHRWSVIDANPGVPGNQQLTADGKQVYGYTMVAETSPIGVIAHEFGHDLGLPDLYDTDGSSSGGVGEWDIMATGSWNGSPRGTQPAQMSAWSKAKLGWITPTVVTSALLNQAIAAMESNAVAFMLLVRASSAGDEYFLVENREQTGFDAALPGVGLLIWHVDDSMSGNQDDGHRLLNLEQADRNDKPTQPTDAWSDSPAGWGPDSTPSSNSYQNQRTGWKVRNIGAAGATMTADLSREVDDDLLILGIVRPCCARVGSRATVNLTVGNHGTRLQQGVVVNLTVYRGAIDAAHVICCANQTIPSLAQGQVRNLTWSVLASLPGKYVLEAYVPLPADEIPENNRVFGHFNAATYYMLDTVDPENYTWTRNGNASDPFRWEIVQDGNVSVSHSPTHAWRFGPQSGVCVLCPDVHTLTSETVNVPPAGRLYLSLWHTYDLRGRVEVNGSVETDTADVSISINGGPWRLLANFTGVQHDWQAVSYNLTSLVNGTSPTVAVQFGASSKAIQSSGGWWVDDIALSDGELSRGLVARAITPTATADPGGRAIFQFKLANVGDFDDDVKFDLDLGKLPGWTAFVGENLTQMLGSGAYIAHLSPDKEATLFLAFDVATDAARGSQNRIPITATSRWDPSIASTFDTVTIINDPFGLAGLERYVFLFLIVFAVVVVIAVVIDAVKKQKGVYRRW